VHGACKSACASTPTRTHSRGPSLVQDDALLERLLRQQQAPASTAVLGLPNSQLAPLVSCRGPSTGGLIPPLHRQGSKDLWLGAEGVSGRAHQPRPARPASQGSTRKSRLTLRALPRRPTSRPATPHSHRSSVFPLTVRSRSMLSNFAWQEAQRERIRVAEREGKPEHTYLGANEWAAQPREWTVECDLG
jgi:hypothetical protein